LEVRRDEVDVAGPPDRDLRDLREQAYVSLDDPRDCAVVSAHFTDGSAWQNPSIGATPGPVPTAVPDAIRLGHVKLRWAPRHGFPTPLPTATEASVAKP
jgi:hypothetical protein